MNTKKLIAANWKMNKTIDESREFISKLIQKDKFNCDVLICPPYLNISSVINQCHELNISVGAQNCYFKENGAYTGEVSVLMLQNARIDYVILGHSERRAYFYETDEIINKKVIAVLKGNIKPIICVGETEEQRNSNHQVQTVINQLEGALENIDCAHAEKVTVAYEPLWAIGTGKTALPQDADKMCGEIKKFVASKYSSQCSDKIRVLYGGSMNAVNAEDFLKMPNVDGGLIGGASLDVQEFSKIIKTAEKF